MGSMMRAVSQSCKHKKKISRWLFSPLYGIVVDPFCHTSIDGWRFVCVRGKVITVVSKITTEYGRYRSRLCTLLDYLALVGFVAEQTHGDHGQAYWPNHCPWVYPEWDVCISKWLKIESMCMKSTFFHRRLVVGRDRGRFDCYVSTMCLVWRFKWRC